MNLNTRLKISKKILHTHRKMMANDFEEKFNCYLLNDFIKGGLTTKEELKKIYKTNPECIEALKEIPVLTALGIGESSLFQKSSQQEQRITIAELKQLDQNKLNKIMDCRFPDEVIQVVRS